MSKEVDTAHFKDLFQECEVRLNVDEDTDTFNMVSTVTGVLKLFEQCSKHSSIFVGNQNKEHCKEKTSSEKRDEWMGGSPKELIGVLSGDFDSSPFLKKRNELKASFNKIEKLSQLVMKKRTRFMSEHDGELDFDRLYERMPFYNARIENKAVDVIDIYCDFSFHVDYESKDITQYGTICWAVVDILENMGIRCNVYITTQGYNLWRTEIRPQLTKVGNHSSIIKVKGAHEYVNMLELTRCFTSNFYRRAIFNLWVASTDAAGWDTDGSLGYSKPGKCEATRGKIFLNRSINEDENFDVKKLEEFIKKSL